jgi:LacI family transcriptional regulator
MMMTTLKRVAQEAGVHVATASAVLNGAVGNTRVSESTRDRVLLAARQQGYVRNESASRLRTGKSNAVGFIGGDMRNPFFSELAACLEKALLQRDLQLVISHVSISQSTTFAKTVQILHQQMVNKIIYWDEPASSLFEPFKADTQMLPIGFTKHTRPGVWLDLNHAIRLSVAYLVKRRMRRVGFFAPQGQKESPSVAIRLKTFQNECLKFGLRSPTSGYYVGESWDIQAATEGARELLRNHPKIDAWLGFNDIAAMGLLFAAQAMSRKPVIVCFDGTPLVRNWPGKPPILDLKIATLAEKAVSVAVGEESAEVTGKRRHWIRPELILPN